VAACWAVVPAQAHAASSLFDLASPGPQSVEPDNAAVRLGVRLTVTTPYLASGVTFYRPPGAEIAYTEVDLWEDGKLVRTGNSGDGPHGGWVRASFREGPYYMSAGHQYVASYTTSEGYPDTEGFFSAPYAPSTLGLRAPVDAGVYHYLDSPDDNTMPSDSWDDSNYWVSVFGDSLAVLQGFGYPFPLFDATTPITEPFSDDTDTVELGVRFSVDAPVSANTHYELKAVRYYRDPQHGIMENHVAVYDSDGQLLARGFFEGEGPRTGVIDGSLDHAVRLTPGRTYTVSYLAPNGGYPENPRGFAIGGQMGAIHYPADAGVYRYGGGYPTDTWDSDDYYVSPLVSLVNGA
jgi:hypothetical protein